MKILVDSKLMLNGHYKMNTLGLYQIFNNEEAAFNIAIQNKMIYNEMICENCNCSMSLITDRSKKFNMVWKCRICRKKISILKYSIFSQDQHFAYHTWIFVMTIALGQSNLLF